MQWRGLVLLRTPEFGRTSNRLVTDEDAARQFEAQLYSDGGALDIVLDEIGTPGHPASELRESTGTPLDSLSEALYHMSAILSGGTSASPIRGFKD